METVVSGVRPTGNLHLGNYFGAVANFIKMQEEYDCYFFVADYHSLTTHPKPEDLHNNVKQVLAEYLACGIDPEKATLYVQSDLPEIAELYLLFNMLAHKGELERATTYKDKVAKQQENINAGLLTYPVLMAVDIIIHRALKVPVGKDQEQHLEMTRTFANRFNHLYQTDYFPEPQAFSFSDNLVKIPGLDGSGKMGKSEGEGNAVFLNDEPAVIEKKVKRAVTDSGPTVPNSEKPDVIQNLFDLMAVVSKPETIEHFDTAWNDCSIRYGDLKGQLAEDIVAFTTPIRERIQDLASDEERISKIVALGRDKARASASKTINDVREIIGLKSF
jgi:tryptophanyl-tRNA synthetase